MNVTVLVHEAEEGGYWAEVADLPGCLSAGETLDELRKNIVDAIEAWLAVHYEDEGPHLPQQVDRWDIAIPESALPVAG